jgi:hypothetical protein
LNQTDVSLSACGKTSAGPARPVAHITGYDVSLDQMYFGVPDIVAYDRCHRKIWAMQLEISTLVFDTCIVSAHG